MAKSNATQWLENELKKKEKELEELKLYQDFIKLQMAIEYSKKLDEKRQEKQ